MKPVRALIVIILILFFGVSIFFYDKVPDKMVSHWNFEGVADGQTPKGMSLFSLPIIALVLTLLLLYLPRLDPLKSNVDKFRAYYDWFIVILLIFLYYLDILMLCWNLKIFFNMNTALAPAFGVLFGYLGYMLSKAKRNWFIGIRTPWTLSSDKVWDKTHELGGKLFMIAGLISVLGLFFVNYAFLFVLIPIISVAIFTVIYSYTLFKKEKTKKIKR